MDVSEAVIVRGACKQYGRSSDGVMVLDQLDMTVTKGTIYGLLGPSGCGKTTLLSCVVGTRTLDAGDIVVLGENPAANGNRDLASRIGYMPQENALMAEFNVRESIYYFGWLYGMDSNELAESYKELEDLLDLPPENRMIRDLSGGQLRRVSLAVTFVHSPKLLILDEPTVGMDPLLRKGIWEHLLNLTKRGVTMIITTHYIEEANQANTIGLMRGGKLLAEGSPTFLISKFNATSLEEVFLLLSCRQSRTGSSSSPHSVQESVNQVKVERRKVHRIPVENNNYTHKEVKSCKSHSVFSSRELSHRVMCMKALVFKNIMRQVRHPGTILLALVLPVLQTTFFALGIGHTPNDLHVGVVNKEMGNFSSCAEYRKVHPLNITLLDTGECVYSSLGCAFIDFVQDSFSKKVYYSELELAREDFNSGKVNAIIHLSENFTRALTERVEDSRGAEDTAVVASEIQVIVDNHNMLLSQSFKLQYIDYFYNFSEFIMRKCGRPVKLAHIPVSFNVPVYGEVKYSYNKFILPGFLTSLTYFLTLSLTATFIILERMEGLWDRTLVAGVTEVEILISFIITQLLQMIFQISMVLLMITFVYNYKISHNAVLTISILVLQGISGMTFGFLASSVFDDLRNCSYFVLGTFIPYALLSGVVWPIEAMPWLLRLVGYFSPGMLSVESLRAILMRGWSLSHPQVFLGFLSPAVYSIVQTACCLFLLKYRK